MNESDYVITINQPKRIGYSALVDEHFVYWIDADVAHFLGDEGKYMISFVDQVNWSELTELGYL